MGKLDNDTREQRILDTAANLFIRFGYDKTTVTDIAHEVGVSKGVIYLHFDSKASLFEALLTREMTAYSEVWLDTLEADPEGGTLAGMYKAMLYAMRHNAFMSAMFKQDRDIFGSYLRQPDNFFQRTQAQQSESPRFAFVKMMQEAGAIRQDIDAKVIAHIMNMLAYGLVSMDEILPADQIPPIEDVIEGIATIMNTALTPMDGGDREVGKTIVRKIADEARLSVEAMEQQSEEKS